MLTDFLIKVIVLLLPTQLGLHFWPAFSRVAGIKVDYLSPTIYLVDVLLFLLVVINSKSLISWFRKHLIFLTTLFIFVAFNTLFAVSPLNTLFWWLRLLEYLLTFLILKINRLQWKDIRRPLLFSTFTVVFIEIFQLLKQASLGGIFYYLGERAFSSSTPGLGRLNLFGLDVVRPMSTFSHPNSLAGYLLTVFYLFLQKNTKPWTKLIPFIGILLTFSKASIVALSLIIFNVRPEIIISTSLLITFIQPLLNNLHLTWQPLSDRLFFYPYLNKISPFNPPTGVGLGGFIPFLGKQLPGSFITPSKLQPIHNIIYLYVAELGVVGTILLAVALLNKKISKVLASRPVIGLLAIYLFVGSMDHYLWTLPQNKLIFIFALSILF